MSSIGDVRQSSQQRGSLELRGWGIHTDLSSSLLCRGARRLDRDIGVDEVATLLGQSRASQLVDALPPFAAISVDGEQARVATDPIGARHVYYRSEPGWAAVSTSLQALTAGSRSTFDREALAVQSLLGWQLGTRTVFTDVHKLDAGSVLSLADGSIEIERYGSREVPERIALDMAVDRAACFLREYLSSYLDEHPDVILQLTGGQDSRILLSAIEPSRRTGLRALTLSVPGSEDVEIAAELADRCGLDHQIVDLQGLADLSPEEAHERSIRASRRLNYMADPVAMAALTHAEAMITQGPRLSGLGGEVARGFYYVGPVFPLPVVRPLAAALAKWRLFSNESVSGGVLTAEFSAWATEFTISEVTRLLTAVDRDWWTATDEFYLFQRMQRWAGVTDSAVCFDRAVTNPMLDRRFLEIARGMRPSDKRGALFLGRLQVALDSELSRVRLDGRPAPEVFARGGLANSWTRGTLAYRKAVRKVRQRIQHSHKPPAGGELLAAKVAQHWRQNHDVLANLSTLDFVRQDWVERVLDGAIDPEPAAVAFVTNLLSASDDLITT